MIDSAIIDPDFSGRGCLETSYNSQERGFSATGRPQQDHKFLIVNVQIDVC
jgi:hypothetical protein